MTERPEGEGESIVTLLSTHELVVQVHKSLEI